MAVPYSAAAKKNSHLNIREYVRTGKFNGSKVAKKKSD